MKTIVLWFRNDLRVHDLPALTAAANDAAFVVPVFILDDELLKHKHSSSNRNRFLLESLADLKKNLRKLEADLIIRHGDPDRELLQLVKEVKAEAVYHTADYTPYAQARDERIAKALDKDHVAVRTFPGRMAVDSFDTLVATDKKPFKVFTPFWKQWNKILRRRLAKVPAKLNLPPGIATGSLPRMEDITEASRLSPDASIGGETAGRQRLQAFLRRGINTYHLDHNDLGADATSRLSSYLHFGCISVREVEALLSDNEGGRAFHRQLAWRDFYHYILMHFPANISQEMQEKYRGLDWTNDPLFLHAWKNGQTGYPAVDAAMRQLKQEGWMHNRARLIVGSFLTKDLGLDWRLGEAHFMRWLCDGDNANNNGNWQWIASVGVDPAPVFRRLYNPVVQAKTYDPDGVYIRRYVPELANVPDKYLAEPWKMPEREQEKSGCGIGRDYPEPIVDHRIARQAALERYRRSS